MFGAIRALIKLALVAAVVHGAVKVVPVFWNYVRFRDACEEIAKFSSKKARGRGHTRGCSPRPASSRSRCQPEAVQVRKQGARDLHRGDYTAQLEYFPTRFYPYSFAVKVQGVPPAYGEYLPVGPRRPASCFRLVATSRAMRAWRVRPPLVPRRVVRAASRVPPARPRRSGPAG